MNIIKKLSFVFLCVALFMCSSCMLTKKETCLTGTFKFKQRPDEIFIHPSFASFLKSNPACKFVLRVPNKQNNVVEEDRFVNRSQYFTIEKALMDNSFRVIDRSLFEKKFNTDTNLGKTADVILELVDYKTVNYYTDKVLPDGSKNDKEITAEHFYFFTGAQVTIKIINIHTSEIVATFVLHYTPCLMGCKMLYCSDGHVEELRGDKVTRKKQGYRSVDIDYGNEMYVDLIKRLAYELRRTSNKD